MPGIVLFNRRWGFGSDDLVFPGLLEIIFRTLWLIVAVVIYVHHQSGFNCTTGYLLAKIYLVIIAVLVLHILSAISVVWYSTRGTILDTTARKAVPFLIYIKLFLVLPETAWIIISTYWAFQSHEDCSFEAVLTVKAAILTDCAVAVVVVIGTAILFDPVGELTNDRSGILAQQTRKVWEKRIKLLFCCMPSHEHSRMAFKDIAQHITVFFKGMDVVPTDIAAGLVLLYHYEASQRKPRRESLVSVLEQTPATHQSARLPGVSDSRHLPNDRLDEESDITRVEEEVTRTNPSVETEVRCNGIQAESDWRRIGLLVHYMRFAMASYGWPLYCMMHLENGCCQIFGCCRCCCRPDNAASIDDNCYQGNTRAILKFTRIQLEDVLYANFHNDVFEVPFFVAVDHQQKAVVVAIRGTMSFWDVLTDLTSDSEKLDVLDDDGEPCRGHKGMAQSAHNVANKLQELDLLPETFQKYPEYHLVITGHSLGAGTATILTLLLREQYPDLKCYAYSPAASLNRPIVERLDDLVCSVVLGEDLVPRMSFLTMLHLRDKVHHQLRETRVPKYKILASGLWYIVCGLPCALERSFFRREDTVSDSSQSAPLLNHRSKSDYASLGCTTDDEEDEDETKTCPLYPPGRIFRISNYSRTGNEKVCYSWARPSEFNEIIVHPMMLFDHLPDVVYRALRKIEKQCEQAVDSESV